ncbi:hypothetical protein FRC03_007388 [Tulasnella sp. 419]|nr:hypothetical protein FRC03_007388 [Tulasnella sp. 419]
MSSPTSPTATGGGIISRALDKLSRSKSLGNGKNDMCTGRRKKRLSELGTRISQKIGRGGDKAGDLEAGDEREDQETSRSVSGPAGSVDGRESSAPDTSSSVVSSQGSSRPPSPQPSTVSRPSLAMLGATFRGDGSMRAGTQTLIQALQAIPWEEDRDDDLARGPRPVDDRLGPDSEADDDEDSPGRGGIGWGRFISVQFEQLAD